MLLFSRRRAHGGFDGFDIVLSGPPRVLLELLAGFGRDIGNLVLEASSLGAISIADLRDLCSTPAW